MNLVKPLVKAILEHPHDHEWTLQGFGMLRTYLAPEVRLHIWDDRYKVRNVSVIHDHPWDFDSYIVAGTVFQRRYSIHTVQGIWTEPYMMQTIACGVGGGPCGSPEEIYLSPAKLETYNEGESYTQKAAEIHNSLPMRGTVTIIERRFQEDTEHAHVFWPVGYEWVSAEPKAATKREINDITKLSLEIWF